MRISLKFVFLTLISFFMLTPNTYAVVETTKTVSPIMGKSSKQNKISFFQTLKIKKQVLKMLKKDNSDKKDSITGVAFLGLALISFLLLALNIPNILDALVLKILFFVAGLIFLILGIVFLVRSAFPKSTGKAKI